jgi:hypothetical protein
MKRCRMCGKTFPVDFSLERAQAEHMENFGYVPTPEDQAIVCDECYAKVLEKVKQ